MTEDTHNRLASEKSPYLLQHSHNPVDWYPWREEAFAKAERENKPILLSIGYSTCHWCHVMAHESFEDSLVAKLLNDAFVSIKVDREERPDIDMQYMKVCQMMTGGAGWPLTIFMTPEKEPFFAATYIPKNTGLGRVGLVDLLPRLAQLWNTRRKELVASARQITAALTQPEQYGNMSAPGERELQLCYEQLSRAYDKEYGGFGIAPKFPTAHNLIFLMRYWKRTGRQEALAMVEKTLQSLQRGGVNDQVGGGFHRYSTDRNWLVPHFEKMIYDQALIASAFLEAYQATRNEEYALTARRTLDYILRDMTSPQGGFYTAEDADSEREEGKFYLWTPAEVESVLDPDDAELFLRVFNIKEGGNFANEATGERAAGSIPYLSRPLEELASAKSMGLLGLRRRLETARKKLFAHREKRVRPLRDDKILTDWNGLVIAALAQAARVLGDATYVQAAERAVRFILTKMTDSDGRLLHRYRDGEAGIRGSVDDYAFFVHGLIEMYETTFEAQHLRSALALNRRLLEHFWDKAGGGLFFVPDDGETLFTRQKEYYDGAVPSGNSVAMLNMVRLSRIIGDADLEEKAVAIGGSGGNDFKQMPSAHTQMMVALDFALGPSYEVVITGGPDASGTRQMLDALNSSYTPRKVIILAATERNSDISDLAPYVRQYAAFGNKATAYVCVNHSCQSPCTEVSVMLASLDQSLI